MNTQQPQVIGIVGGMGPEAGLSLFNGILSQTRAAKDQDHLSAILMSFPAYITDRTAFLEGHTRVNPAYAIAEVIARLEAAGATVVGIACNTAHAPLIYDTILEEMDRYDSKVKLLHMPLEVGRFIALNYAGVRRVGVMATNGTYKSGLYKKALESYGLEVIMPDSRLQQDVVHRMIYDPVFGLKATAGKISAEVKLLLAKAVDFFRDRNTEALVLGCTELSLLLQPGLSGSMIVVDSTRVLSAALVQEATVAVAATPVLHAGCYS